MKLVAISKYGKLEVLERNYFHIWILDFNLDQNDNYCIVGLHVK